MRYIGLTDEEVADEAPPHIKHANSEISRLHVDREVQAFGPPHRHPSQELKPNACTVRLKVRHLHVGRPIQSFHSKGNRGACQKKLIWTIRNGPFHLDQSRRDLSSMISLNLNAPSLDAKTGVVCRIGKAGWIAENGVRYYERGI